MAFQPVPHVALVEMIFDIFEQTCENTLYFIHPGEEAWTGGSLAALGETMAVWWGESLLDATSLDCTLREVKVTDLTTVTGLQVSNVPNIVGTVNSPALPTNATLSVSFRTHLRGRSYRGRNYIVGLAEASVTGDAVLSSPLAIVASAYAQIPDYLPELTEDTAWVVVSREQDNAVLEVGVATEVTTVVIVDDSIDSQRRRLAGRGE